MPEQLKTEKLDHWWSLEDEEVHVEEFRRKYNIAAGSPTFYMWLKRKVDKGEVRRIKRGIYKRVVRANRIQVFGKPQRPVVELNPPVDQETGVGMSFFYDITFRQNDLILLSGFKNMGKTAFCLNLVAENLDMNPVLMGNEYSIKTSDPETKELVHEASPRLISRMNNMDWVQWTNGEGEERFELLPVYGDYAEQIRGGRLNAIDWLNVPGDYYMVSPIMEGIKKSLGEGIGVVVLQKNPGSQYGRGGNPTKDFADVEILLDPFGDDKQMTLLTVETVKEAKRSVQGRKFIYRIRNGVKITDFREVVRCLSCYGKGWRQNRPCDECDKTGYVDKPLDTEIEPEIE